MALCLKLAALRADIRKEVGPGTFRRMKAKEFQRAGIGHDIVISAMGWSEDLGLDRMVGARWSIETLREAARVFEMRPGADIDGDWKMRVLGWIKGLIIG